MPSLIPEVCRYPHRHPQPNPMFRAQGLPSEPPWDPLDNTESRGAYFCTKYIALSIRHCFPILSRSSVCPWIVLPSWGDKHPCRCWPGSEDQVPVTASEHTLGREFLATPPTTVLSGSQRGFPSRSGNVLLLGENAKNWAFVYVTYK